MEKREGGESMRYYYGKIIVKCKCGTKQNRRNKALIQ
jgi:hypothetical protein